eukprot:TRINITY_DN4075_c0_g1_i2.p1 TRINITY_DN4075_c0_g1~~TRINITY_DN4075_c0_g1_i2.p1  ORF type:complete len:360 (+),score=87.46 TRINITY_DN4075_c0_g1_i2:41-1120(+)
MASLREAFDAAFAGNLAQVKKSATKLKNLDAQNPDRGTTLMYTAARFGHLTIVKWLVERGASINKKNTEEGSGSTPLHGACFGGHHTIVDYLCKLGPILQENAFGDTPLEDAKNPHEDVRDSDKKKCINLIKARIKEIEAEDEASNSETDSPVKKQPKPAAKKKEPKPAPKKKTKKPEPESESDEESSESEKPVKKKKSPKPKPKAKEKNKNPPSPPAPVKKAKNDDTEELRNAKAKLEKVDRDCEEFWDLENKFNGCLQGRNEDYVAARLKKGKKPLTFIVREVKKVINPVLEKRYQAFLTEMKKKYPSEKDKWRERTSFHGSAQKKHSEHSKHVITSIQTPIEPLQVTVRRRVVWYQ